MDFEWDDAKAASNLRKHGVSFEEAATVFADPYALTGYDDRHSLREDREITIGHTNKSRVVVTVTTGREGRMRIISARRALKQEVQLYEEEIRCADRGER